MPLPVVATVVSAVRLRANYRRSESSNQSVALNGTFLSCSIAITASVNEDGHSKLLAASKWGRIAKDDDDMPISEE